MAGAKEPSILWNTSKLVAAGDRVAGGLINQMNGIAHPDATPDVIAWVWQTHKDGDGKLPRCYQCGSRASLRPTQTVRPPAVLGAGIPGEG